MDQVEFIIALLEAILFWSEDKTNDHAEECFTNFRGAKSVNWGQQIAQRQLPQERTFSVLIASTYADISSESDSDQDISITCFVILSNNVNPPLWSGWIPREQRS